MGEVPLNTRSGCSYLRLADFRITQLYAESNTEEEKKRVGQHSGRNTRTRHSHHMCCKASGQLGQDKPASV